MSLWKWTKMLGGGGAIIVGGPMLIEYVRPTDEQLRAKYNPQLRAQSIAQAEERQTEFDDFVSKLKTASKSDKHVWEVLADMDKEDKKRALKRQHSEAAEAQTQRDEMRRQAGLLPSAEQKKV